MISSRKITLTDHIIQRYYERILKGKNMILLTSKEKRSIKLKIREDIKTATINNSWINNSRLTTYLFEKYGAVQYIIFESITTIFLTKKIGKKYLFITCWGTKGDTFLKTKSKFNKTKQNILEL